ncbi:hypothetical protein MAR_009628 [Mya arenaria]|uniref:Uncharacterized protein n=1 Tax=Mya arenaria TaxID=6604 RepID=A0ABY7E287_MYAAR|nr:hypothetical protein MAR_009628 [Mya arenaria]
MPFILMRMSIACQTVYGMSVTEVFVGWDDEDEANISNRGGLHPYDGGSSGAGATNHLLSGQRETHTQKYKLNVCQYLAITVLYFIIFIVVALVYDRPVYPILSGGKLSRHIGGPAVGDLTVSLVQK